MSANSLAFRIKKLADSIPDHHPDKALLLLAALAGEASSLENSLFFAMQADAHTAGAAPAAEEPAESKRPE